MKGSCKQTEDQTITLFNNTRTKQHMEKYIPIHMKWQDKL